MASSSAEVTVPNHLPEIRRVVTSHRPDGQAYTWIDETVERKSPPGFKADVTFAVPWITEGFPVDAQTEEDGKNIKIGELITEGGTTVRYVDFAPGHVSPMHRTVSLDYGILLNGEVTLVYPDGATTDISVPGTIVVQRGTTHAWINKSKTEWARMIYVLIPSKPIEINGEKLGAISIH